MTDHHDEHRWAAKTLFNRTWEYLESEHRTPADERAMLAAALGSWFHWRQIGEPKNFAVSDWQVSRVYAVLGDPERAAEYGALSLEWCTDHGLDDFFVAYAHEALARAASIGGDEVTRDRHLAAGYRAAEQIPDDDNRAILLEDLGSIE